MKFVTKINQILASACLLQKILAEEPEAGSAPGSNLPSGELTSALDKEYEVAVEKTKAGIISTAEEKSKKVLEAIKTTEGSGGSGPNPAEGEGEEVA